MADGITFVHLSIPTATTGSLDLVASGGDAFGTIPSGCILIVTDGAAGTTDGAQRSISVTDGTRAGCLGMRCRDNRAAASGTNGAWLTHDGLSTAVDQFIRLISQAGTAFILDADLDSLITNGVRITINANSLGVAASVLAVFFHGDTECGFQAIEVTTTTEETHSGFGLTGEASFAMLLEDQGFGAASTSVALQSIGFCANDGSLTQVATSIRAEYSGAEQECATLSTGSYAMNRAGTVSPSFDRVEVTGFGSDSISLIVRNYTGGSTPDLGIFLVRFAGLEARCGATLTDTDALPHTQDVTATLAVQGGILVGTRDTALDTHTVATSPWGHGVGIFDAARQGVIACSNEDAAATTQVTNYLDTAIAYAVPINTGAFTAGASHKASVAPGGPGFQLTYSVTDTATARYFFWLVWGPVDQLGVTSEALEISEEVVSVQGQIVTTDEDLFWTEEVVVVTVDEVFTTEAKGDTQQGESFRGDIQQSSARGDIQR